MDDVRHAKVCPTCRKEKTLESFGRDRSKRGGVAVYCLLCARVRRHARQATPEYRAWRKEYRTRPAVAAKDRDKGRKRDRADYLKGYLRSPLGKAVKNRGCTLWRLRKATDARARERIARTVAMYDAEIARMKKTRDRERRVSP